MSFQGKRVWLSEGARDFAAGAAEQRGIAPAKALYPRFETETAGARAAVPRQYRHRYGCRQEPEYFRKHLKCLEFSNHDENVCEAGEKSVKSPEIISGGRVGGRYYRPGHGWSAKKTPPERGCNEDDAELSERVAPE